MKLRQFASLSVLCGSLCFALCFVTASAYAQAPELGGLLPSGGPRGQSTQVRIEGKNLAGAHLYVSGGGITVKSSQATPAGDVLTAELVVEPGAQLGPHEVRITTAKGISNGARFWVDVYPNRIVEQPMQEGATPLALDAASPAVINGRIAARAGRDRFAVNATAGETWVFDCFADRIRSRFDPVLELTDEAGISLKLVQSTWESDPRFSYHFTKTGRYTLAVRDSEYNGGPNYTYRLLAGRMALVSSYFPLGERPGHQVQLALQGANLTTTNVAVSIPANAASGTYWAEVSGGSGGPMILPLMVGSDPVLDAHDAVPIRPLPTLPVTVDGVFSRSSQARFTFHAAPKTHILFDLLGRRIGSRIDGEIRVLDTAGKEVASNDDAPGLGKDARLEFAAPKDADYTLEVRNVEEITGPNCYYRLEAHPVEPDFKLSIETDRLAVPAGGTIALPVTLERIGGFDGPVAVQIDGLPAGITSTGGVIAAGKNSIEVTLTAASGATLSAGGVHIRGQATVGSKTLVHEAPGWERYEHRSIDLVLSVEYSYTRPHHLWDLLLAAVTDRTDPATVTTPLTTISLKPGSVMEIPVHIVRQPASKAEVKFDIRGLPAKVTATSTPIPANQTEGKITLTAAADAAPDLSNIIIQAHHEQAVLLAPAIQLIVQKK